MASGGGGDSDENKADGLRGNRDRGPVNRRWVVGPGRSRRLGRGTLAILSAAFTVGLALIGLGLWQRAQSPAEDAAVVDAEVIHSWHNSDGREVLALEYVEPLSGDERQYLIINRSHQGRLETGDEIEVIVTGDGERVDLEVDGNAGLLAFLAGLVVAAGPASVLIRHLRRSRKSEVGTLAESERPATELAAGKPDSDLISGEEPGPESSWIVRPSDEAGDPIGPSLTNFLRSWHLVATVGMFAIASLAMFVVGLFLDDFPDGAVAQDGTLTERAWSGDSEILTISFVDPETAETHEFEQTRAGREGPLEVKGDSIDLERVPGNPDATRLAGTKDYPTALSGWLALAFSGPTIALAVWVARRPE